MLRRRVLSIFCFTVLEKKIEYRRSEMFKSQQKCFYVLFGSDESIKVAKFLAESNTFHIKQLKKAIKMHFCKN